MGQTGATATSNGAATGVPANGMVTMPNGLHGLPSGQYEGMNTAPCHEGLSSVRSVGSVRSVATNIDGLSVTNFNGVTSDGLATTRLPTGFQDGLDTCSSLRTRVNGFNSDGHSMPHKDNYGYDGNLGYDGRTAPAMNYSTQATESMPFGGVEVDIAPPIRRFSLDSDGVRDEDLHGVIGLELPVPQRSCPIGVEVPVPPQGQRAQSGLSNTVTSMQSGFVPAGYQVSEGQLHTTQAAVSTYRSNCQSLETTTAATNAYVPRSHLDQVPHSQINNTPAFPNAQMPKPHQGQQPSQGHTSNFAPPTGPCNIAAPAATFQHQGHQPHMPPVQSHGTMAPPGKPLPTQPSQTQQRSMWAVGSVLEVFSATAQKWHVASIVQVARSDGPDVLTVQFLRNGEPQLKQIYRTDAYLAVLGNHTEGEIPPGFQLQPSQSRPGQFVYLDTVANKKYSSAELAWQLHFERVLRSRAGKTPAGNQNNAPRTGHDVSAQRAPGASMTPYGPAPSIACA